MTNTPNYNLLLAEGTDLVNYLTQTNPNFTLLDTTIKNVSDKSITPATEVTVGTAHAITRSLTDCPVMRFTATSNWTTGDTITVDGNPVSAFKTDGTTLKSGDYIIGSDVIAILQSTRLTVFVSSAAPVNASDIVYNDTSVEDAIDELFTSVSNKVDITKAADITSPYDGRTLSQQLYYIYQRIDFTKLTPFSYIEVNGRIFRIVEKTNSRAQFTYHTTISQDVCVSYRIGNNINNAYMSEGNSVTNISENAASDDMLLYY